MLRVQLSLSAHNPRMNASHFSHDLAPNACPMMLHTCAHSGTQLRHYLTLSHKLPMQLSHCLAHYCAPYLLAFVPRSCAVALNARVLLCSMLVLSCASRLHAVASCTHTSLHLEFGAYVPYARVPMRLAPSCPYTHALARSRMHYPHTLLHALSRIPCTYATTYCHGMSVLRNEPVRYLDNFCRKLLSKLLSFSTR